MKRYSPQASQILQESDNGEFVLFSDAIEVLATALQFASNHAKHIDKGTGDFGQLKPLLEIVRQGGGK